MTEPHAFSDAKPMPWTTFKVRTFREIKPAVRSIVGRSNSPSPVILCVWKALAILASHIFYVVGFLLHRCGNSNYPSINVQAIRCPSPASQHVLRGDPYQHAAQGACSARSLLLARPASAYKEGHQSGRRKSLASLLLGVLAFPTQTLPFGSTTCTSTTSSLRPRVIPCHVNVCFRTCGDP